MLTSEGELMDTATMPSPLASITDSPVHEPEVGAEAAVGLYEYGETHVIGLGVGDCPRGGSVTCPYFERIRIAPDGKISAAKWAYFPLQKKWVALAGGGLSLKFTSSDTAFDGNSWSKTLAVEPQVQARATGPWLYNYGTGDVQYQLNLTASSLAGQEIIGAPSTTYPVDAESVILNFEQKAGVLYTLADGGNWASSSDDGEQYPTVAALRAAHTTTSTPFCLADFDVSAVIYFDSTMHAAGFADAVGVCALTIKSTDKITAVQSGVITLAERPVIAVQIPDDLFNSGTSAPKKQILAIIGLNSGGFAGNGLAYLPGYTKIIAKYHNLAAFKAWLNTRTTDAEAQTLP